MGSCASLTRFRRSASDDTEEVEDESEPGTPFSCPSRASNRRRRRSRSAPIKESDEAEAETEPGSPSSNPSRASNRRRRRSSSAPIKETNRNNKVSRGRPRRSSTASTGSHSQAIPPKEDEVEAETRRPAQDFKVSSTIDYATNWDTVLWHQMFERYTNGFSVYGQDMVYNRLRQQRRTLLPDDMFSLELPRDCTRDDLPLLLVNRQAYKRIKHSDTWTEDFNSCVGKQRMDNIHHFVVYDKGEQFLKILFPTQGDEAEDLEHLTSESFPLLIVQAQLVLERDDGAAMKIWDEIIWRFLAREGEGGRLWSYHLCDRRGRRLSLLGNEIYHGLPRYEFPLSIGLEDSYDLCSFWNLVRFLRDADIKLVRGSYLRQLQLEGRPLPRRQEAEIEEQQRGAGSVFMPLSENIFGIPIVAVSHVWETREHPDPFRHQLNMILSWMDDHRPELGPRLRWSASGLFEHAFFIDFVSVYQYKRTTEQQQQAFQHAMKHMHVLYVHEWTQTWRIQTLTPTEEAEKQTKAGANIPVFYEEQDRIVVRPVWSLKFNRVPYDRRGWCQAELQWSYCRTSNESTKVVDGSSEYSGKSPMPPIVFQERVSKKELVFTHRVDSQPVLDLQEKVFTEKSFVCQELTMSDLPADELVVLAAALPFYRALQTLTLKHCMFQREQAGVLAQTLDKSRLTRLVVTSTPVLFFPQVLSTLPAGRWRLEVLELHDCRFSGKTAAGEAACRELARLLTRSPSLRELALVSCDTVRPFLEALSDVIKMTSSLYSLTFVGNQMTDIDAQVVADMIHKNNSIRKLDLQNNQIRDPGAEVLANAVQSSLLCEVDVRRNFLSVAGEQALMNAVKNFEPMDDHPWVPTVHA